MSEDEYTLEDYIEYHRQPGSKMVAISDFNELVGSMIEENPEVEQVLYKLRQQFGPNEMIPPLALKAKFGDIAKKAATAERAKLLKKRCGIKVDTDKKGKKCITKLKKQIEQSKASSGFGIEELKEENNQVIKVINADIKKRALLKQLKKLKPGSKEYTKAEKALAASIAVGGAIGKGLKSIGGGLKSVGNSALNAGGNFLTNRKINNAQKRLDKSDITLDKKEEALQKKVRKTVKTANKGMSKYRRYVEKDCAYLDGKKIEHRVCKERIVNKKHKIPETNRPCAGFGSKKAAFHSKKYSEMSTSLEDELIEDEYEETCDKCGKVPDLCDHEFEDQLEEVSIEDAQTLQHLVAFKSKCTNVRERLMKGKGRYIEQLKAYMNGDDSAEIRMLSGKKVKVSSLNPKKESLKSLFESFPNGPHIVECD